MMQKMTSLVIQLLIQIVLLGQTYLLGQTEFTCNIRLSPKVLVSCEPLRIDIKIQYKGSTPKRALIPLGAHELVSLEIERINVEMKQSQKETLKINAYQLYTKAFAHETPFPARTVLPGASVLFSLQCFYDWHTDKFLFDNLGVYQITVRCFIPIEENKKVIIQEVSDKAIVVVNNYQAEDKDLWKSPSIAFALAGQALSNDELQKLLKLTLQYPQSPYRPYVLAILGGIFGKIPEGVTVQQRIVYLEELVEKYPQFSWIDYAAAHLCKLYLETGQTTKAKEISKIILNDLWAPYTLKHNIEQLIKE